MQDAFEQVVAQFERPLVQFLYRFVFHSETALDLAQETFVKAFQNLHRYDNARPFSTWLFAIASNVAKDFLRKHSRITEVPISEPETSVCTATFRQPDQQLDAAELARAIEEAVAALPLRYREPLLLRHTAGLSVEQVAEVLGTTVGVVKTRLFSRTKQTTGNAREGVARPMNRDEWLRRASDALDEESSAAACETPSIDGELFAAHLVARHLETAHPALLPADFRATTMRAIARAKSRHTLLLIVKVAFVAGAIMSCAVASALGFDLWNGLFGAIDRRLYHVVPRHPQAICVGSQRRSGSVPEREADLVAASVPASRRRAFCRLRRAGSLPSYSSRPVSCRPKVASKNDSL